MICRFIMPSLLTLIRRFAVATHAISLDRSTVLRPRPERRIGGHQPPHRARSFRLAGFERRFVLSPSLGFSLRRFFGGAAGEAIRRRRASLRRRCRGAVLANTGPRTNSIAGIGGSHGGEAGDPRPPARSSPRGEPQNRK